MQWLAVFVSEVDCLSVLSNQSFNQTLTLQRLHKPAVLSCYLLCEVEASVNSDISCIFQRYAVLKDIKARIMVQVFPVEVPWVTYVKQEER